MLLALNTTMLNLNRYAVSMTRVLSAAAAGSLALLLVLGFIL